MLEKYGNDITLHTIGPVIDNDYFNYGNRTKESI